MPIFFNGPGGGGAAGYVYPSSCIENPILTDAGGKISIRWTDPDAVMLNGEALSEWEGTVIVCKQGSEPQSIDDGVIVCESGTKNQYKDSPLITDIGGLGYYYGIFPYTKDYVVNTDKANIVYYNGGSLEDSSWTKIASASADGSAPIRWNIGDKKTVLLSGDVNGVFEVQLADFAFYDKSDGSGKAGIVFTFTKNIIIASATYGQKFNDTTLQKANMLNDELEKIKNSLPGELQTVIKEVKVQNACGTTRLISGGGSSAQYGPFANAVKTINAKLFPPSYAEVMNGGTFTRKYADNNKSKDEVVKEGSTLELYKYGAADNLTGMPLDKGSETFTRTVYSTYSGYYPGYIYIKSYSIDNGKLSVKDHSLSYMYDINGTGATMGLCPMFCV